MVVNPSGLFEIRNGLIQFGKGGDVGHDALLDIRLFLPGTGADRSGWARGPAPDVGVFGATGRLS